MGDDLERLSNHEFGDIADDRVSMSREDRAALATVVKTTRYNGTHFEVPLPWRTGFNRLPDNLKGRLKRNVQLKEAYCNAMKRNLDLGYIERAVGEAEKEQPLWYPPHHPVYKTKGTSKHQGCFPGNDHAG
ncbi:unnamed protein product [Echinostoma caproni]|uniref:INCENP_ARK-bind domain-containing protein n=1 Tax=Echinostoma caproni TaxID=27848 RepID=A0A183AQ96_9TREM|nr:unnamed protein product [Echinostoma caproni]